MSFYNNGCSTETRCVTGRAARTQSLASRDTHEDQGASHVCATCALPDHRSARTRTSFKSSFGRTNLQIPLLAVGKRILNCFAVRTTCPAAQTIRNRFELMGVSTVVGGSSSRLGMRDASGRAARKRMALMEKSSSESSQVLLDIHSLQFDGGEGKQM